MTKSDDQTNIVLTQESTDISLNERSKDDVTIETDDDDSSASTVGNLVNPHNNSSTEKLTDMEDSNNLPSSTSTSTINDEGDKDKKVEVESKEEKNATKSPPKDDVEDNANQNANNESDSNMEEKNKKEETNTAESEKSESSDKPEKTSDELNDDTPMESSSHKAIFEAQKASSDGTTSNGRSRTSYSSTNGSSPKKASRSISNDNQVIFENLDRNWTSSSPDEMALHRLCFATFGKVFEHSVSFPYHLSSNQKAIKTTSLTTTKATKSPPTRDSPQEKTNNNAPWIPLEVVNVFWTEIYELYSQESLHGKVNSGTSSIKNSSSNSLSTQDEEEKSIKSLDGSTDEEKSEKLNELLDGLLLNQKLRDDFQKKDSNKNQANKKEKVDKVLKEIVQSLTEQHNFLNYWEYVDQDDMDEAEDEASTEKKENSGRKVPCLQIGSATYQEYTKYIFEHDDWSHHWKESGGNVHSMMQHLLLTHVNNTTTSTDKSTDSPNNSEKKEEQQQTASSLILHEYSLLNSPRHCILSRTTDLKNVVSDLLVNEQFAHGRLQLCGMVNGVKIHVQDCELLVKFMQGQILNNAHEDDDDHEDYESQLEPENEEKQMHLMLFAYEAIAKECRGSLEKAETMLELKYQYSESGLDPFTSSSAKMDEKKTGVFNDEDMDKVRMDVAKSLHIIGYSLSKTFGYNVTAPVTASSLDGVSSTIKQQDIQYYQESLSLFSLLRPNAEVNLAQAETLYCLGNCYAYQKYVSLPITSAPSAPLSHLNFLKCSPYNDTRNDFLNTKAMKCYDQSFYLRRTQKGSDDPVVSDSIHAIGVLYFEIKNWSHAVGCFMESLRISRIASRDGDKENDLRIADTQEWIGYCERELGKHQSALTHFNDAMVLRTMHLGKRHPHVAALFHKIGIVHDDLGEMELSLEKYQEALEMFREFGLDDDVECTLECVGRVYIHLDRWEEALECLLESMDMQYKRLNDEILWLKDVTQEDEEARTLPLPMFHNRDNRDGGSNRVLIISTSLDPSLSAGLLRQRKEEDVEKVLNHISLLEEIYTLLTKLRKAKYDDMARVLYRKSKALIKLGKFEEAVKSLVGCKKACWLWEPTGCGLELLVETRLNGMQARMGQHSEAIQGYRELLNRCEKEDQGMSDVLFNMGNSHSVIGEYNEALSCLQKCLRIRKELGETDVEVANVKYCLGVVYCNLRRYETSFSFLEEALETFKLKLGEEHVHVAHSLYYLGQVHQSSENTNLDSAMKYYEEALELYRVHYSPDHISIGHVMHSIGTIHDIHDDYPKAMLCFTDALRVYKLYNDGDHLGVATLMNSMGIVSACVRNQNDLAMTYFDEALRLRKKLLGKRHPAIADTVHNIGGVFAKQGQFEESMDCYKEALDIRREYYGAEHLVVAKTMNNLGIVCIRQSLFDEAMDLFKKVLMIRRMFLDPEDEEIATTLYNIGNIHSRTGEYDLAMVCYEEALRVRRLVLGDSHVSVANMLHNMGVILVDRKKYENAIVVLDEALQLKRIELGDDSLSFSYTLQKIGHVHEDTDDLDQAQLCYVESLNIQRLHLGPDHANIATILMDIGNVHKKEKKYDEALECYEEALHIREMKLGEEHEDVAKVFFAMGTLYDAQKQIEGAMICFGNSARIMKKTRAKDDEERIKVMEALRTVISSHSKINGSMAAFWDTIVVTGDYWLGIEQLLIDLFEILQRYILEPTKKVVKASIKKTMKDIETLASHSIVTINESAAYGALYEGGMCLTHE